MSATKFDSISALCANAKIVTALPTSPQIYWGVSSNDTNSVEWRGGELAFIKSGSYGGQLFLQLSTSGTTCLWARLTETLATSTSTSSSSTTSSTSSTSSTTSTSTSTSSTTSSSSTTTSTSSTTSSSSTTTSTSSTTTSTSTSSTTTSTSTSTSSTTTMP